MLRVGSGVRWILSLCLLTACATTEPCASECAWHRNPYAVVDDPPVLAPLREDVVVRFRHGGFLEGCPTWTFVVLDDGRVEYEGYDNVRVRERRTGQLDADALAEVRELVAELPDHSYDRDYYTHAHWESRDCAFARTVEFRDGDGEHKQMRHYIDGDRFAPDCLRHLEYRIVAAAGVKRWTSSDPFGDAPLPLDLKAPPLQGVHADHSPPL